MNSDKKEIKKLPDGWVLCKSKSNPGRMYYFNKKSGKSSWSQPQADDKPCKKESKKEKKNYQEKRKKEPLKNDKRGVKRKSDGNEESTSKKKYREAATPNKHTTAACNKSLNKSETLSKSTPRKNTPEAATPHKSTAGACNRSLNKSETLSKSTPRKNTPEAATPHKSTTAACNRSLNKSETQSKSTPIKNLANSRLSQLRAQLTAEVQKETFSNVEKSPIKVTKQKISPMKTDTQTKDFKNELKSPVSNDSKCTTTQSPSSDSHQSIPSPSQFFAANKIISSMKAQLPEEYCNKSKQKDTFAYIEQGICNQIPDYPSMKHPSTPPQFSEASKLLSAIKSKLTYKVSGKEGGIKTFSSAQERMNTLRTSLSREINDTDDMIEELNDSKNCNVYADEVMDLEYSVEPDHSISEYKMLCAKDKFDIYKDNVVLVVDTNVFIHELDVIKNVLNSHIKGYSEQPTLLVPWRVINELDRLKDNNNGNGAVCKRAKSAMDYLYKSLPENNRIKGQSLRDANSHIYPCELPDDEILNCCLQQAERGKSVMLLSNDKNLCNKAAVNGVKFISLNDIKALLIKKAPAIVDPDLCASVRHYQGAMYQLLANILENEMRAKYNNLWQHVLFKAPPWTLDDVLQCLLKHWIAVFNEVFPRIENLIVDLKNTLACIESTDPKSLTQSQVINFKELCLEIARKCQIIPEYMELAKLTVDRLVRGCASETDDGGKEKAVVDAFEKLWTVFSSYCAKLSTGLGVAHSVEDKLPGDEPLEVLVLRWPEFVNQIRSLTLAIKGVVNVEISHPSASERIARLETVFKDSLALISVDSGAVTRDNLTMFCSKSRNMLQEAYGKFSQLSELLELCRDKF